MSFSRMIGKVALVTGGGSGIGRSTCQVFAREGASVCVLDLNGEKTQETLHTLPSNHGNKHCGITADVTKADDVIRAIDTAKNEIGKCNVLINNAAIYRGAPFTKLTEKDFDDVINVDLKGVYLMAKEFIKSLEDSNEEVRGTIVNVSSMAGKAGMGTQANYAAAKAGVLGLTKTIALEFPWHRVRCNALLPGFTDTPLLATVDTKVSDKLVNQLTSLRRLARPEEIANACLFLASDESSYVHGASVEVAGGLAM